MIAVLFTYPGGQKLQAADHLDAWARRVNLDFYPRVGETVSVPTAVHGPIEYTVLDVSVHPFGDGDDPRPFVVVGLR